MSSKFSFLLSHVTLPQVEKDRRCALSGVFFFFKLREQTKFGAKCPSMFFFSDLEATLQNQYSCSCTPFPRQWRGKWDDKKTRVRVWESRRKGGWPHFGVLRGDGYLNFILRCTSLRNPRRVQIPRITKRLNVSMFPGRLSPKQQPRRRFKFNLLLGRKYSVERSGATLP